MEQVLFKPVSSETLHSAVTAMLARSIRQHARIFRYFGGSIDNEGDDRLPEHLGPFRTQVLSARAGFGAVISSPCSGSITASESCSRM